MDYLLLSDKINDLHTSAKSYWPILKSLCYGKKIPLMPANLINNSLISNFKRKETILMPSIHPNVHQFQMVELYPLLQLLLLMVVYHLFHLKIKILLTLSVPEKLKNSIFEISIIAQTLTINNLRTTSANSINLHTIRKLTEYSLKNVLVKTMFNHTSSRYCCPKVGRYYHLPSGGKGAKGLRYTFPKY